MQTNILTTVIIPNLIKIIIIEALKRTQI